MTVLSSKELLFDNISAKIILYSNGFDVGEIALPEKGITFFPPEPNFSDGEPQYIIRMRFDFANRATMKAIREALLFYESDPNAHSLKLVIPAEEIRGIEIIPYGRWREWFFDNIPQGYGPIEIMFATSDNLKITETHFTNAEPWVVE